MEFRFKALRHQHDPDDLDTTVNLANPKSWIAVFVMLVMIVAATAWALLGHLPQTISGSGVLSRPGSILRVQVDYSGTVRQGDVHAGEQVAAGTRLLTIVDQAGVAHDLSSPAAGTVMVADAMAGVSVEAGEPLVTIERAVTSGPLLSAMIVVPSAVAIGVRPGMDVDLSVATVSARTYGLLHGRVSSVSAYALTGIELRSLVYDPSTVTSLLAQGSMALVTVDLTPDRTTPSGYSWSSPVGPPAAPAFQSEVTGDIHLGERRPIDYVFGDS